MYDVVVVGGGAAGVFAAIHAKAKNPEARVALLEKSAVLLSKVRVSGGGRCNVTHACFEPKLLVKHYPRGEKELIGPFHSFQPLDTIEWFETRGVTLKTEADGRMFPVTNQSATIIQCLVNEMEKLGVEVHFRQKIETIACGEMFTLSIQEKEPLQTKKLILATGGSVDGHRFAEQLGHTLQKPVPSLFTFNVPSSPLKELSGVCVAKAELRLKDTDFVQTGPLLLTHFGFSGPAALKLSAFGARHLHEKNYNLDLLVNWLPELSQEKTAAALMQVKKQNPQKYFPFENPFLLPKNLWRALLPRSCERRLSEITNRDLLLFASRLQKDVYRIEGKTTHKEEFVTCGGVSLNEVNFKTMESKICPGLLFAGEILDIDGVTGGFNFQNAWTTAFLAGKGS